jgi:hypothetical protein
MRSNLMHRSVAPVMVSDAAWVDAFAIKNDCRSYYRRNHFPGHRVGKVGRRGR